MVADEITADLGELVAELGMHGFEVVRSRYDSQAFGNFYLDFEAGDRRFRIVRDRLQYFVKADREILDPAGLWRAFDDKGEFQRAVVAWVEHA
jgi:hypothetical protein